MPWLLGRIVGLQHGVAMNSVPANEDERLRMLAQLAAGLPRFEDGRIDYSTSKLAPVINCIVSHEARILLLRRSDLVGTSPGKWSGVDGYIDTFKPLEEIAMTELREELGLEERYIVSIQVAAPYQSLPNSSAAKAWIVYPVLVELASIPDIVLDWEHTQYTWIDPAEINRFDTLEGQDRVLRSALALRQAC